MEELNCDAVALEREYRWLEAAKIYESTLKEVDEGDTLQRAEIKERIGYSLLRDAAQADDHDEFVRDMQRVVKAYDEAAELYGSVDEGEAHARTLHCRGKTCYIGFWLSKDPEERRNLLDECLNFEEESLRAYEEAGSITGVGRACVSLAGYLSNRLDLEIDTLERERILDEALAFGERAIEIFSETGDEAGLAEAYCVTSINCYDGAMSMPEGGKIKVCTEKAFKYADEAIEHAEDIYVKGRATVFRGFIEADLGAGITKGIELEEKALEYGFETGDHRLIAEAYDGLTYCMTWGLNLEEELEKVREKGRKGSEYSLEAIRHSALVDYGHGIPHSYINLGSAKYSVATREVDPDTKLDLAEKAVEYLKQGIEHAQTTGSTHATYHLYVFTASSLSYLSTFKTGGVRRGLLEEAMTVAEQAVHYTQQLRPYFYLVRGGSYNSVSRTQLELAKIEEDDERKKELLKKSINNMETGLKFLERHIASFPPRKEVFGGGGDRYIELGDTLTQLFHHTKEKTILRRVLKSYRSAVDYYEKADLNWMAAESHWKIAIVQDLLGEYLESASSFEEASEKYGQSTKNLPELDRFYTEHAVYMKAWSEIERARHHHRDRRYGESKDHYEEAAELHRTTERWGYLSLNYLAWARLEEAEDLSRGEETELAMGLFDEANRLFGEAGGSIRIKLSMLADDEEARMARNLMQALDIRCKYCSGRRAMEEARILDRQGDHFASSRGYGQAAKGFQGIIDSMELESDRRELRPILFLCRAWEKMMMAEARALPSLYGEAAELFMQAKENAVDHITSLLAQAHSSFCMALEVGTKFELNREMNLYSTAKKYIEAATSYYLRAGYQSASEYTAATNRLLDAYMYMYRAQTETDPGQKARFYQMAERLLQASAGSFIKAMHPDKSEEVRRVLEQIKEEKQIAMALTEIMHAPSMVSATYSFSTPTPTHEKAVGLERFENADIQSNMRVRDEEVKVGEKVRLDIELVNAGRIPAQLIKVEGLVPESFEISEVPSICNVEDGYLDMKGRILSPLKTADLKLIFRPREKGTYQIGPRVLYLDKEGKYRSHEMEPVTVVVKEMGIRGWLRGPTRGK